MATASSSMTIHTPSNFLIISSSKTTTSPKPSSLPISHSSKPPNKPELLSFSLAKTTALASSVASTLSYSPSAMAAKQIAESPQEDNRGLVLLLPVVAAVGWVLYNILGPALNQLNRMRNEKMVIVGLGLGGLAAAGAVLVPSALAASEVVQAEGGSSENNPGLLALFVAAAVALEVVLLNSMNSESEEKRASE